MGGVGFMVRTTVHLVRHELTQANIERRYIGWTDQPIIQRVKANISVTPAVVFGSDLLRCRQTASCYFPDVPFVADERLRELHFGDFEMKTYEDLQYLPDYRSWVDDPFQATPPHGESFAAFQHRVLTAFQEIAAAYSDAVFVVHGGVIKLILASCFGNKFHDVRAAHRTMYTVSWEEGKTCMSLSEAPITVSETMF